MRCGCAGRLIAFEGIDGAGKSTLAGEVAEELRRAGSRVLITQRYLIPEITALWHRLVELDAVDQGNAAVLAAADYFTGLERGVRPALEASEVVLADRYFYSHLAHFGARGVPPGRLRRLFRGAREADLVFYLSLPVPAALDRLRAGSKPDFWEAGLDHGPGVRIGRAYRRYRSQPPDRESIVRRFHDYQQRVATLFPGLLPARRTHQLDGELPTAELTQSCLRILRATFGG